MVINMIRRRVKKLEKIKQGMSRTEVYKIALATRNLEINLFWQRCNYFLILNSALAYGYTQLKDEFLILPITLLGLVVCILWYRVALGSKYWQECWEAKLHQLERDYIKNGYFPREITLFSTSWREIRKDVKNSLESANHSLFEQIIDNQILKKPSVTQSMVYLVLIFIFSWLLIFFYQFYKFLFQVAFI
jgi:hypothetical protein